MDSCVVPHRSTNRAVLWLTAQIRRDAVLSESYGRRHLPYCEDRSYTEKRKSFRPALKYQIWQVYVDQPWSDPPDQPEQILLQVFQTNPKVNYVQDESQEFVGWTSADRSTQATLPLTVPRSTFKSSACDSSRTHDRFNWWTARVHLPGHRASVHPDILVHEVQVPLSVH